MSPMNNRLLVPRKTPGLLDLVPGAAAAYSLRSLSNSYADPVVTVRRSSDDAEDSFTANEVADGTLAAFCGAGDGFVKQWWDQSGNARHAVQATTTAQPKIVSSGAVILKEGKPALQFDGSDDFYSVAGLSYASQPFSAFFVAARKHTAAYPALLAESSGATNGYLALGYTRFAVSDLGQIAIHRTGLATSPSNLIPGDNVQRLLLYSSSGIASGSVSVDLRMDAVNSAAPVTHSSLSTASTSIIGASKGGGADRFQGSIQEIIVWQTVFDLAMTQLIEGNLAWGWSV